MHVPHVACMMIALVVRARAHARMCTHATFNKKARVHNRMYASCVCCSMVSHCDVAHVVACSRRRRVMSCVWCNKLPRYQTLCWPHRMSCNDEALDYHLYFFHHYWSLLADCRSRCCIITCMMNCLFERVLSTTTYGLLLLFTESWWHAVMHDEEQRLDDDNIIDHHVSQHTIKSRIQYLRSQCRLTDWRTENKRYDPVSMWLSLPYQWATKHCLISNVHNDYAIMWIAP